MPPLLLPSPFLCVDSSCFAFWLRSLSSSFVFDFRGNPTQGFQAAVRYLFWGLLCRLPPGSLSPCFFSTLPPLLSLLVIPFRLNLYARRRPVPDLTDIFIPDSCLGPPPLLTRWVDVRPFRAIRQDLSSQDYPPHLFPGYDFFPVFPLLDVFFSFPFFDSFCLILPSVFFGAPYLSPPVHFFSSPTFFRSPFRFFSYRFAFSLIFLLLVPMCVLSQEVFG